MNLNANVRHQTLTWQKKRFPTQTWKWKLYFVIGASKFTDHKLSTSLSIYNYSFFSFLRIFQRKQFVWVGIRAYIWTNLEPILKLGTSHWKSCELLCISNNYFFSDLVGFSCLVLLTHFTISSVVRSYLQSQLSKVPAIK